MESLSAKLNAVKSSFQELSNNVLTSDAVSNVLDLANAFLSLLNTPVGSFTTEVFLLSTALFGLYKLVQVMNLKAVFVDGLKQVPALFYSLTGAIKGTTTATQLFGAATKAAFPIILALVAAIKIVTSVADNLIVSLEEQKEIVDNLKGSLQGLKSEYDTLVAKDNLTEAEAERLKLLEAQIEANKILLNQEAQKLYSRQYGEESKGLVATVSNKGLWTALNTPGTELGRTGGENLVADIDNYNELQDAIKDVSEEIIGLNRNSADYAQQVNNLTKKKKELEDSARELSQEITEEGNALIDLTGNMTNIPQDAQKVIDKFKEWLYVFSGTGEEIDKLVEKFDVASISLGNFSSATETFSSGFEQLDEDYATLNSLIDEYNEKGTISASKLDELIALSQTYNGVVEVSNGKLVFNAQALYDAAQQARQKAIEDAKVTAAQQLQAIAINGVADAEKDSGVAANGALAGLQGYINTLDQVASGAIDAASAVAAMNVAITNNDPYSNGLSNEQEAAMAAVYDNYKKLYDLVNSTDLSFTPTTTGGKTSSSTSKATDPIKAQADEFDKLNKQIEFNIWLREQQGASEEELIKLNQDYQDELHKQAEWFRGQGLDDTSEYIQSTIKNWWGLKDTITDLNKAIIDAQRDSFDERLEISENYIQDRNDLEDWGADNEIAAYQRVLDWMDEWYSKGLIDYEHYWDKRVAIAKKKALAEKEAWENNLKAQIESLEKQQDAYEKLFSYMSDRIDEQISLLEKQREEEEAYWDEKIQALQDQNDELNRQIELQQKQEALARAKDQNLLVFQNGQFEYAKDIDAISSAQADLDAYERDEALRKEVENLEKLKDQALSSIDEQIKGWEEYKEQWSSVVDKYQEEQDRLLLEQELGIELEGENWKLRLDNLTVYVEQYEALMQRIANAQATLNAGYGAAMGGGSSGGGGGSSGLGGAGGVSFGPGDSWSEAGSGIINSGKDWSQVWHDADKAYQSGQISKSEADKIKDKAHKKKQEQMSGSGNKFNSASGKWEKYANGTLSAKGGLSLVGEKGAELRVLNPGDGIIPADSTKNLMAMSKMNPNDFKKNGDTILNISNISLPGVKNGNDFIKEMKNLAYQRVYKRG